MLFLFLRSKAGESQLFRFRRGIRGSRYPLPKPLEFEGGKQAGRDVAEGEIPEEDGVEKRLAIQKAAVLC